MMRRFALISAMFLGLAHAAVAGTPAPETAASFVDSVAKQVLDILKTDASTAEKQSQLENTFSKVVNIPFIAKFVLARHWNAASEEQRAAYVAAYEPFILRNYASKLTKYTGQSYKLRDARPDGQSTLVTMEIIDPGKQNVLVDYRLREENGAFKVIDIVVEGVSLIATQRSEFNSIVQSKGIDYLTGQLQKQAVAKKAG